MLGLPNVPDGSKHPRMKEPEEQILGVPVEGIEGQAERMVFNFLATIRHATLGAASGGCAVFSASEGTTSRRLNPHAPAFARWVT